MTKSDFDITKEKWAAHKIIDLIKVEMMLADGFIDPSGEVSVNKASGGDRR